jgi:hypothetical protein
MNQDVEDGGKAINVKEPDPIILSETRRVVIYAIEDHPGVVTFGMTLKGPFRRLRGYGVALTRSNDTVELRVPLIPKNPRQLFEFKAEVEKFLFGRGVKYAYGYTDPRFGRALRFGMDLLKPADQRIRRSTATKQVGSEQLEQWVWHLDEDAGNN